MKLFLYDINNLNELKNEGWLQLCSLYLNIWCDYKNILSIIYNEIKMDEVSSSSHWLYKIFILIFEKVENNMNLMMTHIVTLVQFV